MFDRIAVLLLWLGMSTEFGDSARSSEDGEPSYPEVKTLTLETLRTFASQQLASEAYKRLCAALPPETRAQLRDATPGGWVAESHLQTILGCIFEQTFSADEAAFLEFARGLATAGITRFMRIFLSLASERFVLRKVPVVWARLRRNAGHVQADVEPGLVRLRYAGFPYFGESFCRLVSLANCQALVLAATDRLPNGTIVEWSSDTLVLEFDLSATLPA